MKSIFKYTILLLLLIPVLHSCSNTEELNTDTEATTHSNKNPNFVELCYAETATVDASAMNACTDTFSLDDITINLSYDSLGSNHLDEELKSIFYCNEDFSTCMGAPQPLQVCSVTFNIIDDENPTSGTYDYLSDNITPAISNQIKQHFACEAKAYGDANYTDYLIAYVTFYKTQTLCGGCTRYLFAQVSYNVY
ncbi:hypothetical protein [Pontimicrobium sp. MEBiC06410]